MKPKVVKSNFRAEVVWKTAIYRMVDNEHDAKELVEYINQLKGVDARVLFDVDYACGRCGNLYHDKEEARECCIDEEENMCDTCSKEFAECDGDPKFGTAPTGDNVYDCESYVKELKE